MAERFPDSPYPNDVPGQVTGTYRGYFFRARPLGKEDYISPKPDEYVKEVWDIRNRFYWQGHTVGKAKAVEEIKAQIDVYVSEEGAQEPVGWMEGVIRGPTWWAANPDVNVRKLKAKLLR